MTKTELFSAIREKGYSEQGFFDDLEQDTTGTINHLLQMINAGLSSKAWELIEKLHDEFIYFNLFDDETIVYETL